MNDHYSVTRSCKSCCLVLTILLLYSLYRDPKALQLLLKLFIERSHSLWKVPEVLTWLEENARRVVARVDAKDPLVAECSAK